MKKFLVLTLLLSRAFANLPEDHLLYPRDRLAMELIGVENALTYTQLKREKARCESDLINSTLCSILFDFHLPINHRPSTQKFWKAETQILFFGERHIDQQSQRELSAQLSNMQLHGFSHLALEMFNSSAQASLDAYLNDVISIDEILEVMSRDWSYQNDGYKVLLQTAKALNMKIVALDDRKNGHSDLSFSDDLIRRDLHMAQILSHYIDDKVIVYTGRLHAYKSFAINGEMPVPTIMSELETFKPDIKMENYFLFTRKNSGLFAQLMRMDGPFEFHGVFKSPTLAPYVDGIVLSRFP